MARVWCATTPLVIALRDRRCAAAAAAARSLAAMNACCRAASPADRGRADAMVKWWTKALSDKF